MQVYQGEMHRQETVSNRNSVLTGLHQELVDRSNVALNNNDLNNQDRDNLRDRGRSKDRKKVVTQM